MARRRRRGPARYVADPLRERRRRLGVQDGLGRDHRAAGPLLGEQLVDRAVLGVDDDPVHQPLAEPRDTLLDERQGARFEAAVDAPGDRVLQAALAGEVEVRAPALQVVVRGLVHRVLVQVEHGGAGVDANRIQDERRDRGGFRAGGRRRAAQQVVAVRHALAARPVADVAGVAPGIQQRQQQDRRGSGRAPPAGPRIGRARSPRPARGRGCRRSGRDRRSWS